MEPVSIIVTALVLGAANGLKDVAEESIRDIYSGLKQLVTSRYTAVSAALNMVESEPQSQLRQAVLEEDLEKAGAGADGDLLHTAKQLISLANSLMTNEALAKVGVAIKNVEGGNLEIRRIQSIDTGVLVSDSKFTGDITISDVNAAGEDETRSKKKSG